MREPAEHRRALPPERAQATRPQRTPSRIIADYDAHGSAARKRDDQVQARAGWNPMPAGTGASPKNTSATTSGRILAAAPPVVAGLAAGRDGVPAGADHYAVP